MEKTDSLPIIAFASEGDFEDWLKVNWQNQTGIWLRFYKKHSGVPTISYDEAVNTALCFGWIDGQKKAYDELSYLLRFTPRRARSVWSKINTERVNQLVASGRMQASGLVQVDAAKADGRWAAAYDSQSFAVLPADFAAELAKHPQAKTFYDSLNSVNKYAIIYRLQTAKKPVTREKRMRLYLDMLAKGEKIYPN